eukprot:6179184-Pleurochrysis_carterae.AAC.2
MLRAAPQTSPPPLPPSAPRTHVHTHTAFHTHTHNRRLPSIRGESISQSCCGRQLRRARAAPGWCLARQRSERLCVYRDPPPDLRQKSLVVRAVLANSREYYAEN